MLLAIDVGNSQINCGLFKGKRLMRSWSFSAGAIPRNFYPRKLVTSAVIGSVVPSTTAVIKKRLSVPVLVVNCAVDLGIKIKYRNPRQVGADRLANAVAARSIYGSPALVVDFGTATTIDVISRGGDYLGGLIMPGLEMARQALRKNTALLPLVPLKRPRRVLGQTTAEAVRAGLYFGFRGMIRESLDRLKKELRFPRKTVIIATGGHAGFLAPGMFDKIDPALTLKGLNIIFLRNEVENVRSS